jgi:transposase InsO family protein
LAYIEALNDEKGTTAAGFLDRAKAWFAKHGITSIERIVTDNGACYRSRVFAELVLPARHQRIKPCTSRHNGKVERYNRILAEEFLDARTCCQSRTAATPSWSGICTTTTTDPTEHTTDDRPPPPLRSASTTSWPHTN